MGKVYLELEFPGKILAVWYSLSTDEFGDEMAKVSVGLERNFEAEESETKTLLPTMVLTFDPQLIK